MLQGEIRSEDGQFLGDGDGSDVLLPEGVELSIGSDFTHPYYWSGFTMIGSPW